MKSREASVKAVVSVSAVTVAERWLSSKSARSPNTSPPRTSAMTTSCPFSSSTEIFTVPVAMRYRCVAGSSRWNTTSFRAKCFERMRIARSSRSFAESGAKSGCIPR